MKSMSLKVNFYLLNVLDKHLMTLISDVVYQPQHIPGSSEESEALPSRCE